ncbi:MAG TPA: DUF6438 domain-containing protein [Kofleriaceae bacterium]|jgi:hypothetical protein
MSRLNTWLFAGAALVLACLAILMSLSSRADGAPLSNAAPPAKADAVIASLERTACYGYCPIYKVSIHADGRVEYHGEHFVKRKGDATGQLSATQLGALRGAFVRASFFELADRYEHESMTDAPSAVVAFSDGGRTKTIRHYHGDDTAPASLDTLEERIDALVDVEQWIGTDHEREAHRAEWR